MVKRLERGEGKRLRLGALGGIERIPETEVQITQSAERKRVNPCGRLGDTSQEDGERFERPILRRVGDNF